MQRLLLVMVAVAAAFAGSGRYDGDLLTATIRTAGLAEVELAHTLHVHRGLHVVDNVYELGSSAGTPADSPFRVPESTTRELWEAFAEDGTPVAVCGQTTAGDMLLQRSALDAASGELVIRSGEVRDSLPGAVLTLAQWENPLRNGWASERSSLPTGRLVRDDTSLGRQARVIIVTKRDGPPATVTATGVVGGGSLENRAYFDTKSGQQFAREEWFRSDAGQKKLLYRRVRTIETLPAADAEAACEAADRADS